MNELSESYRWCQAVCKRSKSSFLASFALLDKPRRRSMYALYAFSRLSDDLSESHASPEERYQKLAEIRVQLQTLRSQSGRPSIPSQAVHAPMWPALADTVIRFQIPLQYLDDIVAGVMRDVFPQALLDWAELRDYCYHVASAVGLACVYIWRKTDQIPLESAIDCGIAFQLTNILRDLAEDARNGRIFLPESLMAKHAVDRVAWLNCQPNGQWEELIDEVAAQAFELYDRGWGVQAALTANSARMFSLMWRHYRYLLEAVLANKRKLWDTRPVRVDTRRKMYLLTSHFVPPLYARLPPPCPTHQQTLRN